MSRRPGSMLSSRNLRAVTSDRGSKLARRSYRPGIKTGSKAVVIVDRRGETAADLAQVVGGLGEALVKLLAEFADLPRLLCQPLLAPHRGDGASDGDQIGRGRQQHLLVERIIPQ